MLKRSFIPLLLTAIIIAACSVDKNTFISRNYHSTTAHYNGYFNANDLLRKAVDGYRAGLKEDYYSPLTIRPLPDEKEVVALYVPIDTAISKSTKVIQRHAMPGTDKPAKKKDEHNRWIDENWITIGKANYYRRDYELAVKNFEYVNKFFSDDPSAHVANVWLAKAYIEQGKFTEANLLLKKLDEAAAAGDSKPDEKGEKKKYRTRKAKVRARKKEKAEAADGPAPFPKKLRFELEITKAQFAEKKKDRDNEIKALEASLEFAKKSADKARVHFILGQLYEERGDAALAGEHYAKSLKHNGNYEMNFNARLKRALNGGGSKTKKQLNKMLRDTKNREFRDQIYYTLGQIAYNEGNEPLAISRYTLSALYSTSNPRQKGMAYEKLGDLSFVKKDYVSAQKYYDSCARVIPETYPNAEGVKNKAARLKDLVVAIETAHYEDSVQRIASMSEDDRYRFAEKLVKKMKEDDANRRRLEADRARELQLIASRNITGGGSKFYWNNEKARNEGFDEFKRQWGQRENEDDWRRSEKIVIAAAAATSADSATAPAALAETEPSIDSLTPEMLLAKLPLSDTSLAQSQKTMMSAYYDAGRLYNEQLNEKALAEKQFKTILEKPFDSEYKLMAAFQVYRLYDPSDPNAVAQKDFILINYPTSDYAGYLRDPDYFIKKKERDKYAEQEYVADLQRYENGLHYPVLLKSNQVIYHDKENKYRAKYYLLKANAQAKLNSDKNMLIPTLDSLMLEYPGTPEAKRAADMKNIIVNGYSKSVPVDFSKPASIYVYEEKVPLQVMIFLKKDEASSTMKTRVTEFNREFFGRDKLNTNSKIFDDRSVIIVKEFSNEIDAAKYVSTFRNTKKHLMELNKAEIFFISLENMKRLFETQKVEEYKAFVEDNY